MKLIWMPPPLQNGNGAPIKKRARWTYSEVASIWWKLHQVWKGRPWLHKIHTRADRLIHQLI